MGRALAGRRDKVFLMTKVCTHGRGADVALQQLEQSLKRLQTDHLDLWQVHECVYDNDPERHFAKGGVIEALDPAKKAGKVRYVGFTGHKDPTIHLDMIRCGYPFDSVQMPLNPFDATYRSFQKRVLPEVNRRGIAGLGMKSLGGNGQPVTQGVVTVAEALRYAMSLPVATTISGIDSLAVVVQLHFPQLSSMCVWRDPLNPIVVVRVNGGPKAEEWAAEEGLWFGFGDTRGRLRKGRWTSQAARSRSLWASS